MAYEALAQFMKAAAENEGLQAEVTDALASSDDRFAAIADVAARHGFSVTADDLKAAAEELPDEELAKVSGGMSKSEAPGVLGGVLAESSPIAFDIGPSIAIDLSSPILQTLRRR